MDVLVVIPARLESRRLPAKMLRRIGPRSLIGWTWVAACRAGFPVVIATDSDQIAEEARSFGARVIRTSHCWNGTERCAEVMRACDIRPDVVVNWQGDNPLAPPMIAQALCEALALDPTAAVATPVRLVDRLGPGQSAVIVTEAGRALLFTRQALAGPGPRWAHVGLYAYRAAALERYGTLPSALEEAEQLEQIRWLVLGEKVECVAVDCPDIPEVNELADLAAVARALEAA